MTEYEVSKEFSNALEDMLANNEIVEFNPIREQELQIFSLLVVKEKANGEADPLKGPPIVCKRIPPVFQALTKGHYVVLGCNYFWTHANDLEKKAALHYALMAINVELVDSEEGTDANELKLKIAKPDFTGYRANLMRFGAWNEPYLTMRDALKQSAKQFAENTKPVA